MDKLELLIKNLKQYEKLCVAYSGGVDSSFLLKVAHMALGENAFGIIAETQLLAKRDLKDAVSFAGEIGATCHVIHIDALKVPELCQNDKKRCYFCKKNVFHDIAQKAKEFGAVNLADGKNVDDAKLYRPGAEAAKELGVISPLAEAGFTKQDIRDYSKDMGLRVWDKPSNACLATRLPYNVDVTLEKLKMIESAEEYLHILGINTARVRMHGDLARIEVPREKFSLLAESEELVKIFKLIGFRYITLDLEGFRSGSMD